MISTKTKHRKRAKRRAGHNMARHYWLTPRAWRRSCSHCSAARAVAYRPADRKSVCSDCIARLGINARESQSWRDGGAKAGPEVTVRHVDPATLRAAR